MKNVFGRIIELLKLCISPSFLFDILGGGVDVNYTSFIYRQLFLLIALKENFKKNFSIKVASYSNHFLHNVNFIFMNGHKKKCSICCGTRYIHFLHTSKLELRMSELKVIWESKHHETKNRILQKEYIVNSKL